MKKDIVRNIKHLSYKFNGTTYFFRNVASTKERLNSLLKYYRSNDWNARYIKRKISGETKYLIYTRRPERR